MDREARRTSQPARSVIIAGVLAVAFVIYLWATLTRKEPVVYRVRAIAVLSGTSPGVTGTVIFDQLSESSPVTITGDLKSLSPGLHGFHIHQLGDITDGCVSTGPHFNPLGMTHGAPASNNRHVGDLGNVQSDNTGAAKFTLTDTSISLNGPRSILGRAVVVHAGTDDLGLGGNEESLRTGNAGARLACGVIGVADSE